MSKENEFTKLLSQLPWSAPRFAQILDITKMSVYNWMSGRHDPPGPVVTMMEYLIARPEARAWFEDRRPLPEKKPRKKAPMTAERLKRLREWSKEQREARRARAIEDE